MKENERKYKIFSNDIKQVVKIEIKIVIRKA